MCKIIMMINDDEISEFCVRCSICLCFVFFVFIKEIIPHDIYLLLPHQIFSFFLFCENFSCVRICLVAEKMVKLWWVCCLWLRVHKKWIVKIHERESAYLIEIFFLLLGERKMPRNFVIFFHVMVAKCTSRQLREKGEGVNFWKGSGANLSI